MIRGLSPVPSPGVTYVAMSGYAGYLFIQTATRNFQAGQTVEGRIQLFVVRPLPVRMLFLKFKGTEIGMWNAEGRGVEVLRTRSHVHDHHTGRGHVISQKFPLFSFSQAYLNPGQYVFPFTFTLPVDVPGSFYLAYGNVYGAITYRLIAIAECDGGDEAEKHSLLIHVNQLMTNPIYSVLDSEIVYQPSGCCSEQPVMELKVAFLKNAYAPGERIDFTVEVNNLALNSAIIGFDAILYRTVRVTSNHGHSFTERETLRIATHLQRIPPATIFQGRTTAQMSMVVDGYHHDISHAVSAHSRHVDCAYSVCVKPLVEGGGLEPEIERHLQIYPVQLPMLQPRSGNEQWSPVVMPAAQFRAGAEYHYQPSSQIDHRTRINIA